MSLDWRRDLPAAFGQFAGKTHPQWFWQGEHGEQRGTKKLHEQPQESAC